MGARRRRLLPLILVGSLLPAGDVAYATIGGGGTISGCPVVTLAGVGVEP